MTFAVRFAAIGPLLALCLSMQAQTPSDALMMPGGQICLAVSYSHDAWSQYWEGTLKRENGNIGTLTREMVMPMFALGITDRINLIAALPWMRTRASAGQMAGVNGLQDWGIWLKAQGFSVQAGPGRAEGFAALGFSAPASNYLSDYMPFSLGLGCPDLSLRGILKYELNGGAYLRGQAGFHYRGITTIERSYYFTTHGIYTDQVDVPNALSYGGALGTWMLKRSLRAEFSLDGLHTFGGFDIRRQDMGFPSNRMNLVQIGFRAQYYLPAVRGLGITAAASQVLAGRNAGQSSLLSGGLTWQFGVWK
ncbi:MAG: transporter [Bacteroidia bacterium]|nr:transporter [Bacteroidia bacterium]